jgi:hypothetical protein
MELLVIKVDPSTHRVALAIQNKKAEGILALIQIVVLSLLNTPGRDALDPGAGGGLPAMIAGNVDPNDPQEIFAEVAQRVRKTQQEIVQNQIGLRASAEEKLREIVILGMEQGVAIDEVLVRLRIVNQAGRLSDVVV